MFESTPAGSGGSPLSYAVLAATRPGVTRDLPYGPEDLQWVANTATLIYGERDAVLVDTFTSIAQNAELVDWVRSFGRNLTHIYITHGHGDHFFGIGQLLDAFPRARAVGSAHTVADAPINFAPPFKAFWQSLFPGELPDERLPELLESDHIDLDGHRLEIIDAGHTDTAHSTALWVPSLRLIVAGDVAYNDTHPFTTESTTESREHWAQQAERLATLDPVAVVAGHKKPELPDDPRILAETAAYLRAFNEVAATTATTAELYDVMLTRYPRRANPGSLWGGAKAAKPQTA